MAAKRQRSYEDFEPPVELSEEDGCSILTIYIPGFSKEQIRVQVSSTKALRISGERAYRNKAWQRFHKEFQIPPNCDTTNITANYKGGILHVRQPLHRLPITPKPQLPPPKLLEAEEISCNNGRTTPERANIGNEITSPAGSRSLLVNLIFSTFLAALVLLFVYATKHLTPTMFLGVLEQPPQ